MTAVLIKRRNMDTNTKEEKDPEEENGNPTAQPKIGTMHLSRKRHTGLLVWTTEAWRGQESLF